MGWQLLLREWHDREELSIKTKSSWSESWKWFPVIIVLLNCIALLLYYCLFSLTSCCLIDSTRLDWKLIVINLLEQKSWKLSLSVGACNLKPQFSAPEIRKSVPLYIGFEEMCLLCSTEEICKCLNECINIWASLTCKKFITSKLYILMLFYCCSLF